MSRPRESILSMFDPLHGEDHGGSDNSSGEYDSDKENGAPPLADMTMGSFFTHFKPSATSQERVPRKRLVDIGDITVDESYVADVSEEEESDEDENDENGAFGFSLVEQTPKATPLFGTLRAAAQRTPLGELRNEHKPTPVGVKRMLKRQFFTEPTKDDSLPPLRDGTLPSFVDDINTHGVSFSNSKLPQSPLPEIKISSPQSTPRATEFPSPDSSLGSDDLEAPTPRPRTASHISPDDRLSLDLHASFQMQFNSEDDSFDLLKDKISFFGNSPDFELPLEDEDGEEGNESTPPAINPEANHLVTPRRAPAIERSSQTISPSRRPSSSLSVEMPKEGQTASSAHEFLVDQCQPAFLYGQPQTDDEEETSPFVPAIALATPASKSTVNQGPPPIQALRIVKRSRPPVPVVSTGGRRMSIRPAPRAEDKPTNVPSPTDATFSAAQSHHTRPSMNDKASTHAHEPAASGPRRVPVADSKMAPTRKTATGFTAKSVIGGGPRRVMASEVASQRPSQKSSLESAREAVIAIGSGHGKKAAARPVRSFTGTLPTVPTAKEASRSASTISRPVSSMSRLPAPSFGYKSTARSGTKTVIGAPRRA